MKQKLKLKKKKIVIYASEYLLIYNKITVFI